ncbi:lachnocin family radical SAM-modified peptide [Paraclostridium sordellii]|nr:lachnocin family radical SAM-modified peptide [Paeniclostridium sordellii]QYE99748.1 lachnocin family radical SAM-modified peptide [Paeniclostridium sordellii]
MKNNKVSLKKINRADSSTVRTLGACHCGCDGKPWTAFGAGYMGQYL